MATNNYRICFRKIAQHGGFTLVEVLVSLAILSFGLLGLAMLQLEGTKNNTDAYFRTQASLLAYDIMDRIRANATYAQTGGYNIPDDTAAASALTTYTTCKTSTCQCDTLTSCQAQDVKNYDIGKWYETLGVLSPDQNKSTITWNAATLQYTIVIRWTERAVRKSREWVVQL
jgi:type IV pilus assembly protein PilV